MKKKLIFCLGVNELVEHKYEIMPALFDRFGVFEGSSENMEVSVTYFPGDLSQWENVDPGLSQDIFSVVDGQNMKVVPFDTSLVDAMAAEYDAYYGSPSPLVPAFVEQKKPVMLADFGL